MRLTVVVAVATVEEVTMEVDETIDGRPVKVDVAVTCGAVVTWVPDVMVKDLVLTVVVKIWVWVLVTGRIDRYEEQNEVAWGSKCSAETALDAFWQQRAW